MQIKDIKEVMQLMRDFSVSHLKTGEIELSIAETKAVEKPLTNVLQEKIPAPIVVPEVTMDAVPHKVAETLSVLKLSDEDLVDKLFPLPEIKVQ
jgi:hypothetical protein